MPAEVITGIFAGCSFAAIVWVAVWAIRRGVRDRLDKRAAEQACALTVPDIGPYVPGVPAAFAPELPADYLQQFAELADQLRAMTTEETQP
jgi:hypothetical protein